MWSAHILQSIPDGLQYVCCCCEGLFFRSQVHKVTDALREEAELLGEHETHQEALQAQTLGRGARPRMDAAAYRALMRKLNPRQRAMHDDIMKRLQNAQPFHSFLSGGAGVGKSVARLDE